MRTVFGVWYAALLSLSMACRNSVAILEDRNFLYHCFKRTVWVCSVVILDIMTDNAERYSVAG